MKHVKPNILVSKCLEFDKVRYNGQVIPSSLVKSLIPHVNFVKVCPEVAIGLGVPRSPIRIARDENKLPVLYQPATGKDVTKKMNSWSDKLLKSLNQIHGFLLKANSPSCGPRNVKVYHKKDEQFPYSRDSGMFAKKIIQHFPNATIEDEGRLRNFTIREHFFTRVWTNARFDEAIKNKKMSSLLDFHEKHKMLFHCYNQSRARTLGKILGNQDDKKVKEIIPIYKKEMDMLFEKPAKYTNRINVCQHALGKYKEQLNSKEKKSFLDLLEEYRDERIPFSVLASILEQWAARFNDDYLTNQALLDPFPIELISISDSGKGREL
jgi:uncharacterized protein YbbK (DUF523 family)/uncharacterized protein YbgA (DUF1722 family)